MGLLIYFLLSYLIGSLSWSYIFSRVLWNEDIRTKGSGNAGTSNMIINHGWKLGLLVFFLDFMKGFIVVYIIKYLDFLNISYERLLFIQVIAGIFVVLGHIYPVYFNFKGGKGTATGVGIVLGINPLLGAITGIFILIVSFMTKYIAIGGILFWLFNSIGFYIIYKNIAISLIFLLMFFFSAYLHRRNISRILKGEEIYIKKKYEDKDKNLLK